MISHRELDFLAESGIMDVSVKPVELAGQVLMHKRFNDILDYPHPSYGVSNG